MSGLRRAHRGAAARQTEKVCKAPRGRWTDVLGLVGGRMEMLVAAGDGNAYAGCFTRTVLTIFTAGLVQAGEDLLRARPVPEGPGPGLLRRQPQHLSFAARR